VEHWKLAERGHWYQLTVTAQPVSVLQIGTRVTAGVGVTQEITENQLVLFRCGCHMYPQLICVSKLSAEMTMMQM